MEHPSASPTVDSASHKDALAEAMNTDARESEYDVTMLAAASSALLGSSELASYNVKIPKNCTVTSLCSAIARSLYEMSQLPLLELDSPFSMPTQDLVVALDGSSTIQEPIMATASDETGFPKPPSHLITMVKFLLEAGVTPSLELCSSLEEKRWDFVMYELLPAVVGFENTRDVQDAMKSNISKAQFIIDTVFIKSWENVEKDSAELRELIANFLGVRCDMSRGDNDLSPVVQERLRTAFERPFEDPAKYLDAIVNTIRLYASAYNPMDYYFPAVSLVQTSGSGKSRAMIQMADRGLFVVYCSFMRFSSSGFPRRTKIANNLLKFHKNLFLLYFAACFDEAMKYKNKHREFLKHQMDPKTEDRFWARIERSMNNLQEDSNFSSDPSSHPVFAGNKSLEILFVFDEAREMFPNENHSQGVFVEMCQNASLFKEKCRAFVILMDTTFRVSELAPAPAKGNFFRGQSYRQVFKPLFLIGSMDLGLQTLYGSKMEDALTRRAQYKRGRPLWQSLLDKFSTWVVRDTAIRKIHGGFGNFAIPAFDLPFAATVLRSRVPFFVNQFELASELVASNMWWLVQISDDQQRLDVTIPSEPVIADAGACWMNDVNHRTNILKLFEYGLSQKYFEIGSNGETAAQLVLIIGSDSARRALPEDPESLSAAKAPANTSAENVFGLKTFTGPINLQDFLRHTFSAKLVDGVSKAMKALSQQTGLPDPYVAGKLSFNHFIGLTGTLSGMEALALYFSRSAAICCTKDTSGVDLIIPVLMPNQAGEYVIHADNMSFILVQVSNYARHGKESTQSVTVFNSSHQCKLESLPQHLYVSLYMGLGGDASVEMPDDLKPSYSPSPEEQHLLCPKNFAQYQEWRQKKAAELSGPKSSEFIELWRTHRQVSAAILGLSPEVYPCLPEGAKHQASELLTSLKTICHHAPRNPVLNAEDKKTKSILQRMLYAQDSEDFKQFELFSTATTTPAKMDLD
ncbi:hypothetical protein HDU83_006382 [Entophlyctis luteolus]|nr:hypothetical protein HDU83_006382 [Entophlyctis luteolus]